MTEAVPTGPSTSQMVGEIGWLISFLAFTALAMVSAGRKSAPLAEFIVPSAQYFPLPVLLIRVLIAVSVGSIILALIDLSGWTPGDAR